MSAGLTVLSFMLISWLAAATARPVTDAGHVEETVVRRGLGAVNSSGPLEYMKQLRSAMDASGNPKDVWCLLDRDTVTNVFRAKQRSPRCSRSQRFLFSLSSFVATYGEKELSVSEALLRLYLRVKSDLRPASGDHVTVDVTVTASLLGNNTFTCSPQVIAHQTSLNITSSTPNRWVEWNLTRTLSDCWNISQADELLEVNVNFTLPECNNVTRNLSVPVQVVDPTIVPLSQEKRREYALVQPMLVVYVDNHDTASKEPMTADTESSTTASSSRSKRQTPPLCKLANFTINFADLGLHNILIPYSYNARHCVGSCNLHVIDRVKNITNHARLFAAASLIHMSSPDKFLSAPTQPCCVPVEFEHMHLMEIQKDSSFSYRKYPGMIATKCGCR